MTCESMTVEQLTAEAFDVAQAMVRHGGGFVSQLGRALQRADLANMRRVRDGWPELWAQYLGMAREDGLRGYTAAEHDRALGKLAADMEGATSC